MAEFFSLENLFTLMMLILLQAVLGFDNLLYISIESKRAPEEKQAFVRKMGLAVAIGLRIVLLFVVMSAINSMKAPFFTIDIPNPFASASTDVEPPATGGELATTGEEEAAESDAPGVASTLSLPERDRGRLPVATTHGDRSAQQVVEKQSTSLLFGEFNFHSIVTLFGGIFIIYTAVKEIMHLLAVHHPEETGKERGKKSVGAVIFWIVLMNLVFSFDSILSALALTQNFWTMATAIVISGMMMIWLADHVAEFLKKNRLYEVLGLFILFIVGVMLLGEGGHLAHLTFFTYHVEPMAKSTFYFTIGVLVVIDIVQGRFQKNLMAQQAREAGDTQPG